MNKFERICYVKQLGLNTENSILLTSMNDINNNSFINNLDKFSIRTFKENYNGKTPAIPLIDKDQLICVANKLLNDGFNIILAEQIDPNDTLIAGAAWKNKDNIIIEIVYGPGTVRRITHDNIIDKRVIFNRKYPLLELLDNNNIFKDLYIKFQRVKIENCIFEFSIYNKPIGIKNEQFICWEITPDK